MVCDLHPAPKTHASFDGRKSVIILVGERRRESRRRTPVCSCVHDVPVGAETFIVAHGGVSTAPQVLKSHVLLEEEDHTIDFWNRVVTASEQSVMEAGCGATEKRLLGGVYARKRGIFVFAAAR